MQVDIYSKIIEVNTNVAILNVLGVANFWEGLLSPKILTFSGPDSKRL